MKIQILPAARRDLLAGYKFYEQQRQGIGVYFLDTLYSDIESLQISAGIHRKKHGTHHTMLSKRFPYAVYYKMIKRTVKIHAVLDTRNDPDWIKNRLA